MIYINKTGKQNQVWMPKPYDIVINCPDADDAYNSGYTSGYTDGFEEGYPSGRTDGFEEGYTSGYTDGLSACSGGSCEEEWQDGYDSGFTDGSNSVDCTDFYNSGVTDGYASGYTSGRTDGYDDGWQPGYQSGYTDGLNACSGGNEDLIANLQGDYFIIPEGTTKLRDYAFGYTSLSSITIPSSVTSIGNSAFSNVPFSSITIPSSVTSIDGNAFMSCINLTEIDIPDTVKSLGEAVFINCILLTAATLPSGLTRISDYLFSNTSLTGITLPTGITSIGKSAFTNSKLTGNIVIPSGVTYIGTGAFRNCSGLTSMTFEGPVPATITTNTDYNASLGSSAYTWPIYVPCEAVEDYKTAWPTYAHRIMCHSGETDNYLTLEIKSDGGVVHFNPNSTGMDGKSYDYRINQNDWVENLSGSCELSVSSGDTVQFRGNDISLGNSSFAAAGFYTTTASFDVHGNIMSMYRKTNFENITTIPVGHSFAYFFNDCRGLVSAENLELPATTLQQFCYERMFENCVSLVRAPELPATTLANYCYQYMFMNCTGLTSAPELPAETLTQYCYYNMFNNCRNLGYIKCLANNISAEYSTKGWVNGVSSSGTFVKNSSMSGWNTGYDGIPTGWTVVDAS